MTKFTNKQSYTGRRASILQEKNHWAHRTGIELTPWSSKEEVERFEDRKRQLIEEEQAKERAKDAHGKDGREPSVHPAASNTGTGIDDHKEDRRSYPYTRALLERKRDCAAADSSEDRADEPVQLPVRVLRNRPRSSSSQGHGQKPVQKDCD